jgi:hypothetical protein
VLAHFFVAGFLRLPATFGRFTVPRPISASAIKNPAELSPGGVLSSQVEAAPPKRDVDMDLLSRS